MTYNFEEHRNGTYKEPFSHTQYGVFAIDSKDGKPKFIGAQLDREWALSSADDFYRSTDADESEIETFFVRTRTVTYGTWEDE